MNATATEMRSEPLSSLVLLTATVCILGLALAAMHVVGVVALVGMAPAAGLLALKRPGWFAAWVFGGFFVYLTILQLGDQEPRTTLTGAYYMLLALLLLMIGFRGLPVIAGRVLVRERLLTAWLVAFGTLAAWFALNVVVLGRSVTAYRFLAVLMLVTIPAVFALLSFGPREFRQLRHGLVGLGLAFVCVDIAAIIAGTRSEGGRFSPIEHLDPISTSIVPALGAVALLASPPLRGGRLLFQLAAGAGLLCATVLAGTRGATVALVLTLVVIGLYGGHRIALVATAVVAIGIGAGMVAAAQLGTVTFEAVIEIVGTTDSPRTDVGQTVAGTGPQPTEVEPISSLRMRRAWIRESLEHFPDRPIFGHGVAQLENRTADARRLGTYGERIWPHNNLAEAAFSLGLLGLVPFVLATLLPLVGLARVRKLKSDAALLIAGLFTFALIESNFSGEIGADALLWATAAASVAITADWFAASRTDQLSHEDAT